MRTLLSALPLVGCAAMCVACARMMVRRPASRPAEPEAARSVADDASAPEGGQ